jgi:hypothetical protein
VILVCPAVTLVQCDFGVKYGITLFSMSAIECHFIYVIDFVKELKTYVQKIKNKKRRRQNYFALRI